jgi:hypothetical protein
MFNKNRMFPIPRITESFIDAVATGAGWHRYCEIHKPASGRQNADYLGDDAIIELKIIEEERLEKTETQEKLAKLFLSVGISADEIDISFENIPIEIRREVENILSKPIQTAVKSASNQIRHTREDLDCKFKAGVLFIINNGYNYLNARNFERLVVARCKNDSTQIDYVICGTVEYHQGEFDSYVFCESNCHEIRNEKVWNSGKLVTEILLSKFGDAMGEMMKNQMSPKFWDKSLAPVSEIRFVNSGVEYVREKPLVPDSRFS